VFKLDFQIPESENKISLADPIYLSGSCFSNEIGSKLNTFKFKTLCNPFGTIYNPVSIFKTLTGELDSDRIIESQQVYYHWDCHGNISGLSEKEVEEKVKIIQADSVEYLNNASYLILTLGSAFVYRESETNEIIANCHKLPSSYFKKVLLSQGEIVASYSALQKKFNNNLKIILTISPVRHIRDGLVENNLSKSILLEAVHEIVAQNENTEYFPAYEIMMDELRDYRFFARDMIHPSEEAVDYIWERFMETYFDTSTKKFVNDWNHILHAMKHVPFQPKSKKHQDFLKNTVGKLKEMQGTVDVSGELKFIENQIA
jgi:hypothetical protein